MSFNGNESPGLIAKDANRTATIVGDGQAVRPCNASCKLS